MHWPVIYVESKYFCLGMRVRRSSELFMYEIATPSFRFRSFFLLLEA